MAQDFKANQIRTSQIIVSGSNTSNAGLLIYGSGSATNPIGGYLAGLRAGIGTDVFVFVSGSRAGTASTLFGGDVYVSGALTINDETTFVGRIDSNLVPLTSNTYDLGAIPLQWNRLYTRTGTFDEIVVANNTKLGNGVLDYHQVTGTFDVLNTGIFRANLSGSLQRTSTGLSYLVAGSGVTISSASNGQITISSAGGAGSPGGSNTQIQFNDSGAFGGDDGLIYDKVTKTLTVGNLIVTGSVTAITTSNLTISDPVVYIASGALTSNFKSIIAFASGSSDANKSLIFGSNGGGDVLAAAKQDVQAGALSQASISFAELVPIRASKFEIGGTTAALTSSDASSILLYSAGGGFINLVPGSLGLRLGNASAPVAVSGSNVRFGNTSVAFGGEIPPIPGSDVYFFVSGSGSSQRALFGGDVISSGSILVKDSGGATSVIGTPAGILSASSNIQGGGNLLIAGNATVRGGLLTLSEPIGDGILEQTPLGNLELRNLYTGGQFVASVRTSAGVTSNFLDVRPNGSLTGSVLSVFPSSIYAGAGNPFQSTDTTFFVAGKRGAKNGIDRGTSVFGGDAVISGSTYIGTAGTDLLVINANLASDIIPNANLTMNLGNPTRRFANIFTGDLHLKNDRGDYTLIEEEDCLTIRFNKTGKRYKFVLEPAPEFDEK